MKAVAPQTPDQLRDMLEQLFPEFDCDLESDEITFHAVLMDFTPFYGRHATEFSGKQLKGLAALANAAAESPGPLENAFDTCFFEGLRRAPTVKLLRPFLSVAAKRRLHA